MSVRLVAGVIESYIQGAEDISEGAKLLKKQTKVKKIKKKMGRPPRALQRTEQEIAESLRANGGFVTYTAEELGCSVPNITMRVNRSEYLQTVLSEIKERHIDFAESKLMENINNNEFNAICFYLKCQAKHRGYIDRENIIISNTIKTGAEKIKGGMSAEEASKLYLETLNETK